MNREPRKEGIERYDLIVRDSDARDIDFDKLYHEAEDFENLSTKFESENKWNDAVECIDTAIEVLELMGNKGGYDLGVELDVNRADREYLEIQRLLSEGRSFMVYRSIPRTLRLYKELPDVGAHITRKKLRVIRNLRELTGRAQKEFDRSVEEGEIGYDAWLKNEMDIAPVEEGEIGYDAWLKNEMDIAVVTENYEKAAELKKKIEGE